MPSIDIHDIRKYLPHRYPFLLIDRVTDYVVDESLRAIKNVTVNEPFFQGHFPSRPVMPGVTILEALAQASAILASVSLGEQADANRIYLFAGVDKARFKRQVEPGDQLQISVQLLRKLKNVWRCGTQAHVEGELACSAELLFTYQDLPIRICK